MSQEGHRSNRRQDIVLSLLIGLLVYAFIHADRIRNKASALELRHSGDTRFTGSPLAIWLTDFPKRFFGDLEALAYDLRLRSRVYFKDSPNPVLRTVPMDPRIVLVDIDDAALTRVGRWPWSRTLQARLINGLKDLGCRAIFVDIEYPEPQTTVATPDDPDGVLGRALAVRSPFYLGEPGHLGLMSYFGDRRESSLTVTPETNTAPVFGLMFQPEHGAGARELELERENALYRWAIVEAGAAKPSPPPKGVAPGAPRPAPPPADIGPSLLRNAGRVYQLALFMKDHPNAAPLDVVVSNCLLDAQLPTPPRGMKTPPLLFVPVVVQAVKENAKAEPAALAKLVTEVLVHNPYYGPRMKDPGMKEYVVALARYFGVDHPALLEELREMQRGLYLNQATPYFQEQLAKDSTITDEQIVKGLYASMGRPDRVDERVVADSRTASQLMKIRQLGVVARRDVYGLSILDDTILPRRGDPEPPVPVIGAAYKHLGFSTVVKENDGIIRRTPLVFRAEPDRLGVPRAQDNTTPVIMQAALPLAADVMGLDLTRMVLANGTLYIPRQVGEKSPVGHARAGFALGKALELPVDDQARLSIDFRGAWKEDDFPHISASEVLELDEIMTKFEVTLRLGEAYGWISLAHDVVRRYACMPWPALLPAVGLPACNLAWQWQLSVMDRLIRIEEEKIGSAQLWEEGLNAVVYLNEIEKARAAKNATDEQEAQQEFDKKRDAIERFQVQRPILQESLFRRLFGKIVLIGNTASATTDISSTPLSQKYVNLGMHTTVLNQLLQYDEYRGRYIRRPPWVAYMNLFVVLLCIYFVGRVISNFSIPLGFLALVAIILLHLAVNFALFIWTGISMETIGPLFVLFSTYTVLTALRYNAEAGQRKKEEQQKKLFRQMFETYLDPTVVEAMIADPNLWKEIGGTSRVITAFFSDIAGFTTISELLNPDELSEMLREYLTPMTKILLDEHGIRDKYIGDAIVAFFGAPVPYDDHAIRACFASIEQRKRIVELKKQWSAEKPSWYRKIEQAGMDLNFRIGLNTGQAKVGNFGAEQAKNYTMIGDTVNLASRLEGANKGYKTAVMISESTYLGARNAVEVRELDKLRVVGKLHPVTVYELLGKKGEVPEEIVKMSLRFADALTEYRARRFDVAKTLLEKLHLEFPSDGPTKIYLARLSNTHYLESLPPDWDGSFTSTEK